MTLSPKVKAFLIRQAKMAVATALAAVPTARFIDPAAFHFSNWNGQWHMLVLLGGQVAGAEVAHVILPLLGQGFAWLSGWSQSATPDPLVQAVNTVASESKQAAVHADAAQSAAADVKTIVAETKANTTESKS